MVKKFDLNFLFNKIKYYVLPVGSFILNPVILSTNMSTNSEIISSDIICSTFDVDNFSAVVSYVVESASSLKEKGKFYFLALYLNF